MRSSYTGTVLDLRRARSAAANLSTADRKSKAFWLVLMLSVAHLPLGVIIYNWPILGLLHQVCLFALAFYYALQDKKLEQVSVIVAYLIGAEVLWRMAGVSIYWELGKFASSVFLIVALIRSRCYNVPALPVWYLAFLLPACLITLVSQMPGDVRNILSSNMSGPIFLCVSCIFFSNLKTTKAGIGRILIAAVLPLFSVAFVTLFYTVSTPEIQFTGESNFATSGGFGPNQVSSMLGFGSFLALLILVVFRPSFKFKLFLLFTALLMAAQSTLTFSRGGMYNAVGAIAAAVILLLIREPSSAVRRMAPIAFAGVVFIALIFPAMDEFTGGSLKERFEDTQGTSRTEILSADLNIFLEHPVFGAGVGMAYSLREEFLDRKAMSHTEFARLIAEHGVFGIFAIVILVTMAVINLRRETTTFGKALFVGLLVWSTLFMMNAGMRLAAPSFFVGMTFVSIVSGLQVRAGRSRSSRGLVKA